MKNNRSAKKRRKDERTWAEAATAAIEMSPSKVLGIRPILRMIHAKNLKDISLNKAAENVLTTMLNHHAQLPQCPFYRVKGRFGLYALKDSWLQKHGYALSQLSDAGLSDQESNLESMDLSASLSPSSTEGYSPSNGDSRENHTFSIQGRAVSSDPVVKKPVNHNFNSATGRKNNNLLHGLPSVIGSARRHSSPVAAPCRSSRPPIVNRSHLTVTRASSFHSDYAYNQSPKSNSTLDLETPNSVLVNANMRALVNRETFSMLPPSYRYKLTMLLPQCDQLAVDIHGEDKKVLEPSPSALTNEFFTQAVQEWRERLTEGEFTRETQSRIMQEIAKERSKIDPWKEKFFEEYYGQKQVPNQRLRSRSQNLAAEVGHQMRDLGMDAQLALFSHLRPELEDETKGSDLDLQISDDNFKDAPTIKRRPPMNNRNCHLRSLAISNSHKKNLSYAERIARTKLANSKMSKFRTTKPPTALLKRPVVGTKLNTSRRKEGYVRYPSSIIMRPSPTLSILARCAGQNRFNFNDASVNSANTTSSNGFGKNNGDKILHVRRRSESGSAIADHSYTSILWQQKVPNFSRNNNHAVTTRPSTTLVLCPKGNLVNLTIANLQAEAFTSKHKDTKNGDDAITSPLYNSCQQRLSEVLKTHNAGFKVIKPAAHMLNNKAPSSDTERILSLCARPLTPESFVTGAARSSTPLLGTIKQVPSPLTKENQVGASLAPSSSTKVIKQEVESDKENPAFTLPPVRIKHSPSASTVSGAFPSELQSTPTSGTPVNSTAVQHNMPVKCVITTQPTIAITQQTQASSFTPTSFTGPTSQSSFLATTTSQKLINQSLFSSHSSKAMINSTSVMSTAASSPLIPGRFSLAGTKRPLPPPSGTFSSISPNTKWSNASNSPPLKKTRTLAEIKAQMKAKRAATAAAAANVRPALPIQTPGSAVTSSKSPFFSAATFPVYFRMVSDGNQNIPAITAANSLKQPSAAYIQIPTTPTLPLEKVHWVSQQDILTSGQPVNTQPLNTSILSPAKASVSKLSSSGNVKTESVIPPNNKTEIPPSSSKKSERKGKITLKIKAAGSAISLKVDADVIQKEMKRSRSPSSNEDDSSSDETISDDSDAEREYSNCHYRPTIRLPRPVSRIRSSDSEPDVTTKPRWRSKDLDTGQDVKNGSKNISTPDCPANVAPPALLAKPPPVFGIPPFNVSVKPASSSDAAGGSFVSNSLFSTKSSLFRDKPVSGSWSTRQMPSAPLRHSSFQTKQPDTGKYRSTSKGKDMQELARTNIIHSDDSADDDADSSDDDEEYHGESAVSTTTVSENEKCSDSDDCATSATGRWLPDQSESNKPSILNAKRQTRSTIKADDGGGPKVKVEPVPGRTNCTSQLP